MAAGEIARVKSLGLSKEYSGQPQCPIASSRLQPSSAATGFVESVLRSGAEVFRGWGRISAFDKSENRRELRSNEVR